MSLIWSYLKKHKKLLIASLIFAAINQGFSLLDPQVFRLIVDNYAMRAGELPQAEFIKGVALLIAAFIGVAFISRIANSFQDYSVSAITQRMGAAMYARSVEHSFNLPYALFEDQRSGELLRVLQKARDDAQLLIQGLINTVFLSLVGIIFVVIYGFTVHWSIGLSFFIIVPLLGIANFAITRKIKVIQKTIVAQTAELSGSTTETLRNVELVKSMGLEDQEVRRLNNVNDEILELELRKIKLVRLFSFIQGTLINAVRALLVFLLLWLIFKQVVSIGEYFTLLIYSFFVFTPLREFGTVSTQYQEAKASSEQLAEILAREPESRPQEPKKIGTLKAVMFKNVTFEYTESSTPALSEINIEAHAGETVAFVGPSGSGKSTTVKLISGLYQPTKGTILLNGVDMTEADHDAFKQRIGLVAQETQLFAGSIRENLLFVNPHATDKRCCEVLEQAAATSILKRANKGLDTKIGEGGLKLSGGERQRLAIARALLRDPDLIIFDEATSSLDSITEKEISDTIHTIEKTRKDLIMIIVAHRLSTIVHVDRIYVFEKGSISEQGTHRDLLDKKGLYAALWREQMGSREIF